MKTYLQSTPYTRAAAALMVIINSFDPSFELTRENEFRIWHASAPLPVKGCSLYGLALFAKRRGLVPRIVVGNHEFKFPRYRFKGYKKVDVEMAAYTSELLHKQAVAEGITIEERDFSVDDVKQYLAKDSVLLLRLDTGYLRRGANVLDAHYYCVWDHEDGHYIVMDPKQGEKKLSDKEFEDAFNAVVSRCKRDHRMIVFGAENRK